MRQQIGSASNVLAYCLPIEVFLNNQVIYLLLKNLRVPWLPWLFDIGKLNIGGVLRKVMFVHCMTMKTSKV